MDAGGKRRHPHRRDEQPSPGCGHVRPPHRSLRPGARCDRPADRPVQDHDRAGASGRGHDPGHGPQGSAATRCGRRHRDLRPRDHRRPGHHRGPGRTVGRHRVGRRRRPDRPGPGGGRQVDAGRSSVAERNMTDRGRNRPIRVSVSLPATRRGRPGSDRRSAGFRGPRR